MTATTSHGVVQRVTELRTVAERHPQIAQDAAWAWFARLGRRTSTDRPAAEAELAELFRSGAAASMIDGGSEGVLVGWSGHPALNVWGSTVTGKLGFMPWSGKHFDARRHRGTNLLTRGAAIGRVLWPRYPLRRDSTGYRGFDFVTRVERSAVDPETDVLVIDYSSVSSNPRLIIRSIRDELVEIVPRTYLGMMLWRRADRHHLLGYFALKTPVAG